VLVLSAFIGVDRRPYILCASVIQPKQNSMAADQRRWTWIGKRPVPAETL